LGVSTFTEHHPALHEFGTISAGGVPIVRPEVALLFKAKATRYKDQRDFDAALSALEDDARSWLGAALDVAHRDHPCRKQL